MRRCVLLLLAASVLAQDQVPPKVYYETIGKGVELYNTGKYDEALTQFARARRLAPFDWQGHAWQAFTLLQQAIQEKAPQRKAALTREAESMTAMLVKQCGMLFQHPLRHYILGLAASVRGEQERALQHLTKAYTAPPSMFQAFNVIQLRNHVARAYSRALTEYAKRFILQGLFEQADPLLQRAERIMPANDKLGQRDLQRSLAVVDEGLSRNESAVKRLRKCIELNDDRPELQVEFIGTIAHIYFKSQRYKEGLAALAEAPADSQHPEILSARCAALLHPALEAAPDSKKVDEAIRFFRDAMAKYPKDEVYRLVEDYATLILHKVGRREAKKERALLEETVKRLLVEVEIRPECPSLYFLLYKLYKLLGDKENEIKFQNLHAQKKKEYEGKARFDHRGRPRCR